MVTIKNLAHRDTISCDGAEGSFLDGLILILNSTEHSANRHGDIFKYVHEKPRCYNRCEKAQASNAWVIMEGAR